MSHGRLVLLGGGGHAAVVFDAARSAGWTPAGYLDDDAGARVQGLERLGAIRDAEEVLAGLPDAAGHAAVGRPELRRRWTDLLGTRVAGPIVHASAVVSPTARLEAGVLVGPLAVVNARAVVGRGAIVNSGAIVEHDCVLGEFCHVAPGAVLGGGAAVGPDALVGLNAVVLPGARVDASGLVRAGGVSLAPQERP